MLTFDFKFHNLTIRAVEIEGEPWFVAMDVCGVLGIEQAANAARSLYDDERLVVTRSTYSDLFTVGRGSSRLTLISESGLYKLVLRSDKPEAKEFQHWATSVVLPAIRKDSLSLAMSGLRDFTGWHCMPAWAQGGRKPLGAVLGVSGRS